MSFNKTNTPKYLPITLQPSPKAKDLTESAYSQKQSNPTRPLTYTFYHPGHTQSAVSLANNNKQFQRREYRYVSQSFVGSKPFVNRTASNQTQKEQKNEISSKNYAYKIVSREVIETPQPKVKEQNAYYSANPIINSAFSLNRELRDLSKLQVKKISSYEQLKNLPNNQMVESTIISQQYLEKDEKLQSKQNQARYRGSNQKQKYPIPIQSQLQCSIKLNELNHKEMGRNYEIQRQKLIQLESKNLKLVQELLSNQTLIRSFQQKVQVLNQQKNENLQKYKKSQQSLKISRNIISTLNEKMARNLRQNEEKQKILQQKYQSQILDLKHSHQQVTKQHQSTIFQLKLKVIDQTNAMQQALLKAEEHFKANAQKQKHQLLNKLSDALNSKQLSQNQIRRLNQVIVQLQSDLIKLDSQNIRMDQEIGRLLQINSENSEILAFSDSLKLENEQLIKQILQVTSFLEQLRLQNTQLKARETQISAIQITERNSLQANLAALQSQIITLRGSIQEQKIKLTKIQNQKQGLLQQLQQKDGQIARLNITKGSLMLENLKFKDKIKKRQSQELSFNQQEIHSEEVNVLKSEIASMKKEIMTHLSQISQKEHELLQKVKAQQILIESLKRKGQEIQALSEKIAQINLFQETVLKSTEQFKVTDLLSNSAILSQKVYKCVQLQLTEIYQWINSYQQCKKQRFFSEQKAKDLEIQVHKLNCILQKQSIAIKNLQEQVKGKANQEEDLIKVKMAETNMINQMNEQKIKQNIKQIQQLSQQLERSSKHIQAQTNEILTLKQQLTHYQQTAQKLTLSQALSNELRQKLNQQTKSAQERITFYQQTVEQQTNQIVQLQKSVDQYKGLYQTLSQQHRLVSQENIKYKQEKKNQTDLQLEIAKSLEIIQQQRLTIEELNRELQMQQKDYRTMVEEQINKITILYSEQGLPNDLDPPPKQKTKSKAIQFEEPIQQSPAQNQVQESQKENSSNSFEEWTRDELVNKLRELQFVNKSLEIKVQEINKMQESLNDIIISKLKQFETNLQRNEQQKHELQHKVGQLTQALQMMSQKCQNYQEKIEWIDNMYKELQSNLNETVQELIRTHAFYLNLKLEFENERKSTFQQVNQALLDQNTQLQKENQTILKRQQQKQVQNESNFQKCIKQLNEVAENNDISLKDQSKQAQQIQLNKKEVQEQRLMQEQDPLADCGYTDFDLEQGQYNYYVKQATYGGNVYEIKISNANSQSEEELQQQQNFGQDYDILQGWVNQDQQFDERMYKKEQTKNQIQQPKETSNPMQDFILKTIKQLDQKDAEKQAIQVEGKVNATSVEPTNQVSNYIMNVIKNLEQKEMKSATPDSQIQEQEKYQCYQAKSFDFQKYQKI